MRYVPGGDCIDLLEERERLLPEKLVARIIHQLLVVLNYCHKSGITHRDVKPENIMLTSLSDDAFCKVIDFGLATPYKGRVKEFAGTVSYLAPELAIAQAEMLRNCPNWYI
ncbi:CDPK-related kinase 4 (AtCRK4) (Calcium/calmodulin-dependent protein kinase CRK4) [Durusdinium trenchii]|uniref:CDPK-related kinase 4 (AtCRK4) (Calcium/calmodulin-dependent protein kinase CRK4) n=1 Tax=Durusdinium trenchii TaxID=1381693 RepID=A0ABP0H9C4_9DINO